jgi:hypothetical protein
MPKRKAILIPDWLIAVLRDNRVEGSIYQHTPAYMHWKPLEKIVEALLGTAQTKANRSQLEDTIRDIESQYKINNNNDYSLVARYEFPKNIPFTVIVDIAEDVPKPATTHHIVLRLWRNGHVKDIERVYSLGDSKKN